MLNNNITLLNNNITSLASSHNSSYLSWIDDTGTPGTTSNNLIEYSKDNFLSWLSGFAEAEGCFKIKAKYRDGKKTIHSFYFEFEIHLHLDDRSLLETICQTLEIGRVYPRLKSNSCSFIVGNEAGIRSLLTIFDKHQLNGIKFIDYQDFKKAFLLYFERNGTLSDDLREEILKLQNGLNTGRTDFSMPKDHKANITPY